MAANEHAIVWELLPVYALGSLEAAEASGVRRHVAGCPECRDELSVYERLVDVLALAALEVAPSAGLRGRLLAAAAEYRHRSCKSASVESCWPVPERGGPWRTCTVCRRYRIAAGWRSPNSMRYWIRMHCPQPVPIPRLSQHPVCRRSRLLQAHRSPYPPPRCLRPPRLLPVVQSCRQSGNKQIVDTRCHRNGRCRSNCPYPAVPACWGQWA